MSIESAKAFIEKLKTDEDFAKKATACIDAEARMAFAREAGFDFTADEILSAKEELSGEELDSISGGTKCAKCMFDGWDIELK